MGKFQGFEIMRMSALSMVLIWAHLAQGGEHHFARPDQAVSLPCPYPYEDQGPLTELSVQWKSPHNSLLCHFVKHKAFMNCSAGYQLWYWPARIILAIERVQEWDYGAHLCSVSKRHHFTDTTLELQRAPESITPVSGNMANSPAQFWSILALVAVHVRWT